MNKMNHKIKISAWLVGLVLFCAFSPSFANNHNETSQAKTEWIARHRRTTKRTFNLTSFRKGGVIKVFFRISIEFEFMQRLTMLGRSIKIAVVENLKQVDIISPLCIRPIFNHYARPEDTHLLKG